MTGQELCDMIKKNGLLDAEIDTTCSQFDSGLYFRNVDGKLGFFDVGTRKFEFLEEREDDDDFEDWYDCSDDCEIY